MTETEHICARCKNAIENNGNGPPPRWRRHCEACEDRILEMADLSLADFLSEDERAEAEAQHDDDGWSR